MGGMDDASEPCDGTHPLIWPDGHQTCLYDLVMHPGCPHQPWWARPKREEPGDQDPDLIQGDVVIPGEVVGGGEDPIRGYEQARQAGVVSLRVLQGTVDPAASPLDAALHRALAAVAGQLEAPTPLRSTPVRAVDERCYVASFGPVHYRGCACKR